MKRETTQYVPHRILIVEDDKNTADALKQLLQNHDHEVAIASDGDQALERSKVFMPSVVICDIALSGRIDGYAVGSALRAVPGLESVHLIALTGYGANGDRNRTKRAGFDHHLTKPVSIHDLYSLLAHIDN